MDHDDKNEVDGIWVVPPLTGSLRWIGPLAFALPATSLAMFAVIAVEEGAYGVALSSAALSVVIFLLGVVLGTWRTSTWVGSDRAVVAHWRSIVSRRSTPLGTLARVRINRRSELVLELESGKRLLFGGFASRDAAIAEANRLASLVPVGVDDA